MDGSRTKQSSIVAPHGPTRPSSFGIPRQTHSDLPRKVVIDLVGGSKKANNAGTTSEWDPFFYGDSVVWVNPIELRVRDRSIFKPGQHPVELAIAIRVEVVQGITYGETPNADAETKVRIAMLAELAIKHTSMKWRELLEEYRSDGGSEIIYEAYDRSSVPPIHALFEILFWYGCLNDSIELISPPQGAEHVLEHCVFALKQIVIESPDRDMQVAAAHLLSHVQVANPSNTRINYAISTVTDIMEERGIRSEDWNHMERSTI